LTVALDGKTHAGTLVALVRHRAGVTVVTGGEVGLEGAPAQPVATVVGTGILVVALDRSAETDSLLAVISHRAGVAVHAFAFFQGQVLASLDPGARVLGTSIIIVAQVDEIPSHFVRLVGQPITVIVASVALLRSRFQSIAG